MNYFAHALPFLEDPYFAVATGVPDWLSVVDRSVRVRRARIAPYLEDSGSGNGDRIDRAIAGGIHQHLVDDGAFHETAVFSDTMLQISKLYRQSQTRDRSFRPSFLGHLLTEVLLDWALIEIYPAELDRYYELLSIVDAERIEAVALRFAKGETDRLAPMIRHFAQARILNCYARDDTLLVRIQQVMRRVGLPPLPEGVTAIFPEARRLVMSRREELLAEIPVR